MSKFNPDIHHRRSIRLKEYDYSQAGLYFITICTHNRKCLFGEIANGIMLLSDAGIIVNDTWLKTPEIRPNIELNEFVVMPNHFHAIFTIVQSAMLSNDNNGGGVLHTPENNLTSGEFNSHENPIDNLTLGEFNRPYGRHRKPLVQSCAGLNHRYQNKSDFPFGNAITTNTLFVIFNPIKKFLIISLTTLQNGRMTNFINNVLVRVWII